MFVKKVCASVIPLGVDYVLEVSSYEEETVLGGTSFGMTVRTEVVSVPYTKIFFGGDVVKYVADGSPSAFIASEDDDLDF